MISNGEQLSPAIVLAKLLDSVGPARMTPWLLGTLHLVAVRLEELDAAACPSSESHLQQLNQVMPRAASTCLPARAIDIGNATIVQPCDTLHAGDTDAMCDNHLEAIGTSLQNIRHRQNIVIVQMCTLSGAERVVALEGVIKRCRLAMQTLDPEAMLQTLVQVVGLMSPPRKLPTDSKESAMAQLGKPEIQAAEQSQLREILLDMLGALGNGGLDLEDAGTLKLLKVPFACLQSFLTGVNLDVVRSSKQWAAIAQIVGCATSSDIVQPADKRVEHRTLVSAKDRAHVDGGYFRPNIKIRQCSTIYHRPYDATTLRCTVCRAELQSCWYFVHPVSGMRAVIAPDAGHRPCTFGNKRAAYITDNSIPVKRAAIQVCDYCSHQKLRSICKQCCKQPNRFCTHGKRRDVCNLCRTPRPGKHILTVREASNGHHRPFEPVQVMAFWRPCLGL